MQWVIITINNTVIQTYHKINWENVLMYYHCYTAVKYISIVCYNGLFSTNTGMCCMCSAASVDTENQYPGLMIHTDDHEMDQVEKTVTIDVDKKSTRPINMCYAV